MVNLMDLVVIVWSIKKSKKLKKLSKLRKLKSEKSAKSKKPLKIGNLLKFHTKEARPSFITLDAKMAFNCLWLTFTKAPIL